MISTISLAKNNDSEACHGSLQIGHLLNGNGIKWEFQYKSSKMLHDKINKIN